MYMSFAFIYVCHLFWNLESLVTQSCLTLCKPKDCNPPCSWDFTGKNPGVGSPFPSPGGLPDPGIKPRLPILQADSLLSELPGKPLESWG